MSSSLNYKQATNVERRTWDREKYAARARARTCPKGSDSLADATRGDAIAREALVEDGAVLSSKGSDLKRKIEDEEEQEEFVAAEAGRAGPAKSQRAYLKSRKRKVDLDSKVGKTEIVAPDEAAVSNSDIVDEGDGGPSITDGITKSSTGVGWHCKVCDCYLKDSLTYLDHINGRKHQRYLGFTMRAEKSTLSQVQARMAGLKRTREFSGSGSKPHLLVGGVTSGTDDCPSGTYEEIVRAKDEEALRKKAERARKREERRCRAEKAAAEECNLDPDIAAAMGFTSFGGGKK